MPTRFLALSVNEVYDTEIRSENVRWEGVDRYTHVVVARGHLVGGSLRARLIAGRLDVLESVVALALEGLLRLLTSGLLGVGLSEESTLVRSRPALKLRKAYHDSTLHLLGEAKTTVVRHCV